MKSLTNLYFIRHFQTKQNFNHITTGNLDVTILNYPNEIKGIDFIKDDTLLVFCSSLTRCLETLSFCENKVGFKFTNPKILNDLQERNFGDWQGKFKEDILLNYPSYYKNGKYDYLQTPPNGESIENIIIRLQNVINLIKEVPETRKILICSHNHIMKILVGQLYHTDIMNSFHFENGRIYQAKELF
jgi:broad specificity phosphatase PhoE